MVSSRNSAMPSPKGLGWSCVVGLSSCNRDSFDQACSTSGSMTAVEELGVSGKEEEHRKWSSARLNFGTCAGVM